MQKCSFVYINDESVYINTGLVHNNDERVYNSTVNFNSKCTPGNTVGTHVPSGHLVGRKNLVLEKRAVGTPGAGGEFIIRILKRINRPNNNYSKIF